MRSGSFIQSAATTMSFETRSIKYGILNDCIDYIWIFHSFIYLILIQLNPLFRVGVEPNHFSLTLVLSSTHYCCYPVLYIFSFWTAFILNILIPVLLSWLLKIPCRQLSSSALWPKKSWLTSKSRQMLKSVKKMHCPMTFYFLTPNNFCIAFLSTYFFLFPNKCSYLHNFAFELIFMDAFLLTKLMHP